MEKKKMEKLYAEVERIADFLDALLRMYGAEGMALLTVGEGGYINFFFHLQEDEIYAYRFRHGEKLEMD